MKFEELHEFLTSKMRLSHIYQPVLIKALIEAGGSATIRQLAIALLSQDESQIMFYQKRFKEMPMKVLLKHGIITRDGDLVHLGVKRVSPEQRAELRRICEEKIQQYVAARGLAIWDYRMLDNNPVPDSLRYPVLKEANGRCALCGVTKDERPPDVDHIIPRSWKGKNDYCNLQALRSKCNRSKQHKDDTDFRNAVKAVRVEECVFCEIEETGRKILENSRAYTTLGSFQVSEGHTLIIPRRHFTYLK